MPRFLEDFFNFFTDIFVEFTVKNGGSEVFIFLKIQLNREISDTFGCEGIQCPSEKGCFACLPGGKDDNVAALFDASDEICKFGCPFDDIVSLGIYGASSLKIFHLFSHDGACLLYAMEKSFRLFLVVSTQNYCSSGLRYSSVSFVKRRYRRSR